MGKTLFPPGAIIPPLATTVFPSLSSVIFARETKYGVGFEPSIPPLTFFQMIDFPA